eukprot:scaffold21801_cov72-Phaeocystis_antarctica.AAC.3
MRRLLEDEQVERVVEGQLLRGVPRLPQEGDLLRVERPQVGEPGVGRRLERGHQVEAAVRASLGERRVQRLHQRHTRRVREVDEQRAARVPTGAEVWTVAVRGHAGEQGAEQGQHRRRRVEDGFSELAAGRGIKRAGRFFSRHTPFPLSVPYELVSARWVSGPPRPTFVACGAPLSEAHPTFPAHSSS